MSNITLNISELQLHAPNVWKDFIDYISSHISSNEGLKSISIEALPFEMILGYIIRYSEDNGIALDLANTTISEYPEMIVEAFIQFEDTMRHYS